MTSALCPGSFDPPTLGHVDIIERCAAVFDRVLVGIVENPSKAPLFAASERQALLEDVFREFPTVEVATFQGLLVDFAGSQSVDVVVKGLRGVGDFEYELQMAQMNHELSGMDTMFIATNPAYSYLSSSLVKEVARLGGDVQKMLPANVYAALKERM